MGRVEHTAEEIERLINSYVFEAHVYQSLLALAKRQGTLLEEEEDVDGCAALFEQKDDLIRSITGIEAEIEPLKRHWWGGRVTGKSRDRLNCLLDCILNTIEAIMEQEQRNEQLLLGRHAHVRAEIDHVQRGAAMHRTHVAEEPMPRFIDMQR